MKKETIIFAILTACGFMECVSKSLIAPFFPTFAEDKGITEDVVGLIISANPIGSFGASLILGKVINEVDFKIKIIG